MGNNYTLDRYLLYPLYRATSSRYPSADDSTVRLLREVSCHSTDQDILHCHHSAVDVKCYSGDTLGLSCSNCATYRFLCGNGACVESCTQCSSTDSRYCSGKLEYKMNILGLTENLKKGDSYTPRISVAHPPCFPQSILICSV